MKAEVDESLDMAVVPPLHGTSACRDLPCGKNHTDPRSQSTCFALLSLAAGSTRRRVGAVPSALVELRANDLDKLRQEIINVHAREPGLDAATLKHHLTSHGFGRDVETLSPHHLVHAKFALSADRDQILAGWRQALGHWRDHLMGTAEVDVAAGRFALDGNQEHVLALPPLAEQRRSMEAEQDGPAERRRPPDRPS